MYLVTGAPPCMNVTENDPPLVFLGTITPNKQSVPKWYLAKSFLVPPEVVYPRRRRPSTSLVVEPTQLKNMRKSNWIISPRIGVNIKQIFELPPPSSKIRRNVSNLFDGL